MKTRLTNLLAGLFTTLRPGNNQYRALFEQAADAILVCQDTGRILESNPGAARLLGYSKRELALMNIADFYCRRENKDISPLYEELLANKTVRTERKKTEQALRSAIERYHILARATGDTIWDWDIVANTKIYDPGLKKLFGYDIRQIDNATKWLNEKLHPEDLSTVISAFQHAITHKLEHLELEYRFRCADGSYKNIFDRSFVIYNANRMPIRVIGSMQDITAATNEEKRVEKAILEAQEKERLHIGQELHDNINQILASAHMTLHAVKDSYHDVSRTHELVTRSRQRIEEALLEIRKLSHQLAPAVPDGALLKDMFLELFNGIDVRGKYNIDFQFDNRLTNLTNETLMLNLYRIMQEQLKNIVKYAEAKNIVVILRLYENHIFFRIRDDGRGFDARTTKKE